MAPNWADKTIFAGDNLPILRGMNSDSVDLIYLDPPFNSNTDYAAPIGSEAAGAEFKDTWTLNDIDGAWLDLLKGRHFRAWHAISSADTRSDHSYLIYMAVRLLEMKRILKPTGSIYLHCDPTMSHYLRTVMDGVFRKSNFQNEIVWRRATAHNDPKRFGNNTDRILYYGGGGEVTWNGICVPKTDAELEKAYPKEDRRGRYRAGDLTGAGARGVEGVAPWKDYDVASRGRHWSAPLTGKYAEYIEKKFVRGYRSIRSIHGRLDALDAAGLIHHPDRRRTGWPGLKRYAEADAGNPVQALFLDISGFTNYNKGKEWTGYPTQKPLALLERIIKSSSNEGDVVLDPFCGCATTMVAADRLRRRWVGIDIALKTVDLVVSRIKRHQGLYQNIVAREDLPVRTDLRPVRRYNHGKNREFLYAKQRGYCLCGEYFDERHMTVDHIIDRASGGTDHIENLQLLCSHCNSVKGHRGQEYLMLRLNEMHSVWRRKREPARFPAAAEDPPPYEA